MIKPINTTATLASPELMLFENTYSEFVYPKHFHETYLIEVIENGTEDFYCNGVNYKNVVKDSLVLINPGEVHTGGGGSVNNEKTKLICRVFYPELSAFNYIVGESTGIRVQQLSPLRFKSPVVTDQKISRTIHTIYNLLDNSENHLLIKELYHEIMFELLSKHMTTQISFDENYLRYSSAIERGKEYINDNLADKLLLDDIAKAAYISPFHFLRVFKKFTGITLHQYVMSLRIERAKSLLLQQWNICDIISKVGFMDQVHFTKVFRKLTGLTPKLFKEIVKD